MTATEPREDGPPAPASEAAAAQRRSAARMARARDGVEAARRQHPSVDLALSVTEHDRSAGGGLLSAALAFRLFLWLLPASLVAIGGLGFLRPRQASEQASSLGLSGYVRHQIADAATSAHRARWVALLLGLVLLLIASNALAQAVVAASAIAWGLPARRARRPAQAIVALNGALLAAVLADLVVLWLRHHAPGAGVVALLATVVVWLLLWLGVSLLLPHPPDVDWRGLLPGAVLFGVGVYGLHLATVFYLSRRVSGASNLYGALGGAATLLLWAFLLCRLAVAASSLNATWAAHRRARSERQAGG